MSNQPLTPGHLMVIGAHAGDAENMDGWRADIYLDASAVWDDYLAVLRSHALMRGGVSSFRYLDYYDALGVMCGCLGGFTRAVAVMLPPGGWRICQA